MCGVVGILGQKPVASRIVGALKRLEYRGYDSAGIATLELGPNAHLTRVRASGKLEKLEEKLAHQNLSGLAGIGHTRWATHGEPSETNAHPHATNRVALVHNGIIENFRELKGELEADGVSFETATDTEVVLQLIDRNLAADMEPVSAVKEALARLEGAFAIVVLFEGYDDLMVGARRGSPLAVGYGTGEMFFGSDAMALAPFTDKISYLDDGDVAVLTRTGATIYDAAGAVAQRPITTSAASSLLVEKGPYKHFMAKEIHEQPEVVGRTLAHYLDFASGQVRMPVDFASVDRLAITACGTAYYAALVAKYWFERYARLPVDIDIASEFRYREQPLSKGGLSVVVSQSGETADTLASLLYMKGAGNKVAAVVNVQESAIARAADYVLPTLAGPEVGVASTKAFTCQLATLACMALAAGKARNIISPEHERTLVHALSGVPRLTAKALEREQEIRFVAKEILNGSKHVLYLGRGTSYPLALEGALKLKEISYIHAEGYAAGELKHGPIALIDKHMPVVVIAPTDSIFDKTMSNLEEVAARGGKIILFTDTRGAEKAGGKAAATVALPYMHPAAAPFAYAVLLQLLAYHKAVLEGTDVDQPRNLAKSVTVE